MAQQHSLAASTFLHTSTDMLASFGRIALQCPSHALTKSVAGDMLDLALLRIYARIMPSAVAFMATS